MTRFALRGRIFTPVGGDSDPGWRYWEDGTIVVEDGKIVTVGDSGQSSEPDAERLPAETLLVPGLIDTHLHGPQLEMIGSYGGDLLHWLETYTFPTEALFADQEHAARVASLLFPLLIRHGTTTALVFSSIHEEATRQLFRAARDSGIRAVIGKTLMDRNAPAALLESVEENVAATERLLEEWHGAAEGRLGYAITPRFAPTSSAALLEAAGDLGSRYPDAWIHTHISENEGELALVRELYPEASSYADVYDRAGLLRERTVLAHGVHLSGDELEILATRGAGIAHCPNSNLFLGSGLFPMERVEKAGVSVGLGSDIGAGTSPSLLGAMADTYKVQQILGRSLTPFQLFRLATLGGAETLGLQGRIGSLEAGKEADMVLIRLDGTPLIRARTRRAETIEDLLAAAIFLGDDRLIGSVWVSGVRVDEIPVSDS